MKIYMKDGSRLRVQTETQNDLEVDVGTHPGYVHVKKYHDKAHVTYSTLFTIPKESIVFINYENAEEAGATVNFKDSRDGLG